MKLKTNIKKLKDFNQDGFTLIELLVVIGILAILLAVTLIAINPNKHFQDARNAQRESNVEAILDGIYEYESANGGQEPPSVAAVTSTAADIGGESAQSVSATAFSTPDLTLTVSSGNIIGVSAPYGSVTVSGCDQTGDNGTFAVVSGTSTSIVVDDASGSGTSATGCSVSGWTERIDVCTDLVPTYLAALPADPSASVGTMCTGNFDTGYTIAQSSGRFTIAAPHAEDSATISVTR
jgi:prepilin-type N-terminal cleavage/methylation domain-containing protein